MALEIGARIGIRDALVAEHLHEPAIEKGRIMGDGGSSKRAGPDAPLAPADQGLVLRQETERLDQGCCRLTACHHPQYSSASMRVRTRTVTFGSAGSGEWKLRVRS